jgi:hypothetical protein
VSGLPVTPEHELKPHLVWLGHFLGLDVYMDVQKVGGSGKHAALARRMFKNIMEQNN